MSPYDIEFRMKILQELIPQSDIQKILEVCYERHNNNLIELANCLRLSNDTLSIEDTSESLFIWLMLEETNLETIKCRVGNTLLNKIKAEATGEFLKRLEHSFLES